MENLSFKKDSEQVLVWYQKNKRMLPWRQDKNPYHVWISEIMLQQTRIEAVIDYYCRFIDEVPSIKALAKIEEDRLLKLWEGLGYYSRARNLKKAAAIIMKEYGGNFPSTYLEMIKLPGIGEYTASAIASICFNEKTPAIDGNVLRVYTRYHNDHENIDLATTKKKIRENIGAIIPKEAGDFNEGLMELGETICLPAGTPKCEECPLKRNCIAKKENTWNILPIKKEKIKQKEIKYTILIFKYKDSYAIEKREETLLNELWGFPSIKGHLSLKDIKEYLSQKNLLYLKIKPLIKSKHVFSHQIWNMKSYYIELDKKLEEYVWSSLEDLKKKYAIPTAYQPFLKELDKRMNS